MGSYTIDSHNVQRYVNTGWIRAERRGHRRRAPASLQDCLRFDWFRKNRNARTCWFRSAFLSSHIAFGSIRMEPVFMILGQSATTAACLALDQGIAVQDLDYATLRAKLIDDGQVLELEDVYEIASKDLPGIVIDDRSATLTGGWKSSSANRKFIDSGYQHNDQDPSGDKSATFQAKLEPGRYEVRMSYPPNNNRATNVPVDIIHAGGESRVLVDQRMPPSSDGLFQSLGTYTFSGVAAVVIRSDSTDGYVIIDAVQFVPVEP